MKQDVEVTVIKLIQVRHKYKDGGKDSGYNKKYQKPKVAAEDWARIKNRSWEEKKYGHYSKMGEREWDASEANLLKLIRRSLPIFKRMIE